MLSIIIVAIILFGASVPFAVVWLSTLGNPNRGRISGLSGARFVAHMDRGMFFVPEFDEFFNPIPFTQKVVDSREELIKLHVNLEKGWHNYFDESGMIHYFPDVVNDFFAEADFLFRPEYYDTFFPEYSDEFFATGQLVFINYFARPSWIVNYQVGSIVYLNNTLTIEFVTATRLRGLTLSAGGIRRAIVEITRISDDLNIEVSSRDRWVRFPFWLW